MRTHGAEASEIVAAALKADAELRASQAEVMRLEEAVDERDDYIRLLHKHISELQEKEAPGEAGQHSAHPAGDHHRCSNC